MRTSTFDRCFIAVWPDDASANALDALTARLHAEHPGAVRVQRANLHLTLAFIGPLPLALQEHVARDLAAVEVVPFNWCIDRVGTFASARVAWAANATPDRCINALADRVRTTLEARQIGYDRHPFTPHVTLLRKLSRAGIAGVARSLDPPIHWAVRRVALLKSVYTAAGVHYVEVESAT